MSPVQFGDVPNELLERTLAYERLVSGHESALGDAPAYDPGPMRTALRKRGYSGEDSNSVPPPEEAAPGLLWLLSADSRGSSGRAFER